MSKKKAQDEAPKPKNTEINWKSLRLEKPLEVQPYGSYKNNPETIMYRSAGHSCPREKCSGVVTWLNKTPLIWKGYWVYCPKCMGSWLMQHKYLWPIVQKQFEEAGVQLFEPQIVEEQSERTLETLEEEKPEQQVEEQQRADVKVEKPKRSKKSKEQPSGKQGKVKKGKKS